MPDDDDLIGVTYYLLDELEGKDKLPMLMLINDRIVHVAPNTSDYLMTYQDIMNFITKDYWHDSARIFQVQPRISIFRYIGRVLGAKLMEISELFIENDMIRLDSNFKTRWETFIMERVVS